MRLIDADTIHWHDDGWACIRKDEYPSIDIVRCKECVHRLEEGRCVKWLDDDFCSYGEREDE